MIYGRPTTLWLGVVTTSLAVVSIIAINIGLDPTFVAQLTAAIGALLGAVIILVAGQPPAVNDGGRVTVHTANGQPDVTAALGVAPSGAVKVLDSRIASEVRPTDT